jgi:class 3 adenylate cyclase/putative methionine-R-sulfoxide reductase with GAF domain
MRRSARKAPGRKASKPKRANLAKGKRGKQDSASNLREQLRRSTAELAEARAQQTATADVLKVISRSAFDLQPVLSALVSSAIELCNASTGVFFLRKGDLFHLATVVGSPPTFVKFMRDNPLPLNRSTSVGRAASSGEVEHVPDVLADPEYQFSEGQRLGGYRTLLAIPLLRDGEVIGVFSLARRDQEPFTQRQIDLVTTFADQAVIAIQNVRLFEEVRARTRDLMELLQQQTAMSEVLKVVSGSVGELEPVFTAMLESAARICDARHATIFLRDGDLVTAAAQLGPLQGTPPGHQTPLDREWVTGRAILDAQTIHVRDLANSDEYRRGQERARRFGQRAALAVPLVRDGAAIGAILLRRPDAVDFTPKQIELVTNFASQAVIAIEKARLFNETREALERQTATADILKVIASSPTNAAPVLQAIAESACALCVALDASVTLRQGDHLRFVAHHGPIPINLEARPITRNWTNGRAVIDKETVHVHDLHAPEANDFPEGREMARRLGVRTVLAVPLVRDQEAIGTITLRRDQVQPFSEKQITLLQTFADQAVIAIQNVRLFEAVQARTKELRDRTVELEKSYDLVRQQASQLEAQSQELLKLNQQLEQRVADQVGEIERMSRLRRFLPPQVADLIVASGSEKQLESHRREITALFCDLRGFTGFSEASAPEDVMALLRDYHAAIGEIIIKYSGTLERYAGDGVMVVFNDPVLVDNPALRAVLMALETREAMGALMEKWRQLGHDVGFGIGIAHGFATLGTIGFEGRFDYSAIGTVSNVASRLCDEAKPGQILISPRVFTAVKDAVTVEPVGEFTLKGIARPLAAYNVCAAKPAN